MSIPAKEMSIQFFKNRIFKKRYQTQTLMFKLRNTEEKQDIIHIKI